MPKEKLLKVVIKKSRWYRGKSVAYLRLIHSPKQCCIGFLARQLGAKVKDIRGISILDDILDEKHTRDCVNFAGKHNDQLDLAYNINDNPNLSDTERIQQLKEVGRKMAVQFIFKP